MKKILLFLSVIVLSLASCSTDEPIGKDASAKTTNVSVLTIADAAPATSATGKNVPRGNIYAWVNTITLNAKHVATNTTVSDLFNLTGNYNASTATAFGLDNVLLGPTVFTATSTTDSAKRLTLASTSGNATTVLASLKNNNPWVVYQSGDVAYNVSGTTPNIISIPMTTQQGRMLAVFQMDSDSDFRNKFKATINVTAEGETIVPAQNVPIQGNGLISLEWSSDKSLDGKKLTYTITVSPINANMYPNTIPTTYTIVETISASTSYSCLYTITKDKAPKTNVNVDNIKFTFQKWVESGCPTGDCDN